MLPIKVFRKGGTGGGGGGGAQVNIFTLLAEDFAVDPANATASYSLFSHGGGTASGASNWTWLLSGSAADYQVRMTVNSGTLSSGTTGTWLSLSTDRSWSVIRASPGVALVGTTVEIRRVSDSVVIDTATITLSAQVEDSGGGA